MVGKTGSDNRERLFCLFELRLDQIDLAEPVIGVDRQITFRIFIDKFVYPTNGLIVFFLITNQVLDLLVGLSFFRIGLAVFPGLPGLA